MGPTIIKIMPVDDQPACREAIELTLLGYPDLLICDSAMNGAELLEKLKRVQPDIILMDNRMPVMDGIEATKKVKERYPQIKVLAYSSQAGLANILEMQQAGADGYILKTADRADLRQAIKTIMEGNTSYCTPTDATGALLLFKDDSITAGASLFSEKEQAVLQLICREYTSQEIAHELFMSIKTVEKHRAALIAKTNSRNVAGLVLYAYEHGLYNSSK
ncbi:MAG: response regulator transcription factor [Niabella sp.]|nr:response regulator transcription factor [Niabella sp.]